MYDNLKKIQHNSGNFWNSVVIRGDVHILYVVSCLVESKYGQSTDLSDDDFLISIYPAVINVIYASYRHMMIMYRFW